MVFWTLAIALTALACAALYYAAAGRTVNASGTDADAVTAHHRQQLIELDADIAAGRLGEAEGMAAKAELAREVIRLRGEGGKAASDRPGRAVIAGSAAVVALATMAIYAVLGSPHLPASPLVSRSDLPQNLTVDEAIVQVERQLELTPDDVRGWTVIAPIYMRSERYADAERAYRNILRLQEPTADAETDLAEALLMQNGGVMAGEPTELLESAAARDATHVRSRFYLAGEATRAGDYALARTRWEELIALGQEGDPWLETARNGLATAEAGLTGAAPAAPDAPGAPAAPAIDEAQIRGMVEGLDARLRSEGGSIEEWTQLVRSRLVLGELEAAQSAYDAAVAAYPDPAERSDLDALARSAQLEGTSE